MSVRGQMKFSQKLKFLLFLTILLSIGLNTSAATVNFETELVATIPNPAVLGETLSTRILLGTNDRATDRFDTAWDVVAIQGGMIQAYIDHSEYDQATHILWRDTRTSTGFPKEWNLLVQLSQAGNAVSLKWSAETLSNLPTSIRMRLVDLDGGSQELDMRSTSIYTYVHVDSSVPHHFRIIADEPVVSAPPADTSPPPSSTPPVETPPVESPPKVSTPALSILTDLLPSGILGKPYKARLEAQGGTTPYHWKVVGGKLPMGLKLNTATGTISGKPRRIGQYRIMIQLVDANGLIFQKAFTLSIIHRGRPFK